MPGRTARRSASPWRPATSRPTPPCRTCISNSDARLRIEQDSRRATDASGTAQFHDARRHPLSPPHGLARGFRPAGDPLGLRRATRRPLPDHLLFQMEKATNISGRVVDQDQKPIAGATVVIDVAKGYPQVPAMGRSRVSDDRDRRERAMVVHVSRTKPDSVKVAAYHHLCLTEHTFFLPEEFKPVSALRDGSATLRLRRGTTIDGTVVGPDGRPVADAEVIVGNERRYGNSIPPVKTDAKGRFALGHQARHRHNLTARHAGFGPAVQPIRVGSEPQRRHPAAPAGPYLERPRRRSRRQAHFSRRCPSQIVGRHGVDRTGFEDRPGRPIRLERGSRR